MSTCYDAALLSDWMDAVEQSNLDRISVLCQDNPGLQWIPINHAMVHEISNPHLNAQLEQCHVLGSSFEPLNAFQYSILKYTPVEGEEQSFENQQNLRLIAFFIEEARVQDLNRRTWGSSGNTTLHLASFLGHHQIVKQLLDKGATMDIPNDSGCLPRDVTGLCERPRARPLSTRPTGLDEDEKKKREVVRLRPNYSTPDRFKQLRQLAESSAVEKKAENKEQQKKDGHYFKVGRVEETKLKVLNEEEAELEKQRARRQKEVDSLAKRSAVKNNPFVKRKEQERTSTIILEPSAISETPDELMDPSGRCDSKVISALKDKSYVSSSVFRQTDPADGTRFSLLPGQLTSPTPSPSSSHTHSDNRTRSMYLQSPNIQKDEQPQKQPIEKETAEKVDPKNHSNDRPSVKNDSDKKSDSSEIYMETKRQSLSSETPSEDSSEVVSVADEIKVAIEAGIMHSTTTKETIEQEYESHSVISSPTSIDSFSSRRLSGSQKAHWSAAMPSWTFSLDQDFKLPELNLLQDENDEKNDQELPPVSELEEIEYKDVKHEDITPEEDISEKSDHENDLLESHGVQENLPENQNSLINHQNPEKESPANNLSPIPGHIPNRANTEPLVSSVSLPTSMLVDSLNIQPLTPLLPLSSSYNDVSDHSSSYGSVSVRSTSIYSRRPQLLSPYSGDSKPWGSTPSIDIPHGQPEINNPTSDIEHHTPRLRMSLSSRSLNDQKAKRGKLYVRIKGAHNLLLPLPREQTYARCVVSDGRYEYMSRYEVLGQDINFDYECIIDTYPDMIITVSLHVRPDQHVKTKAPITRLFTSTRKRKETLSGYVSQYDGAIGQTRFALIHMLHACYQKPYEADFDCFNAWYDRSSREKQRQQKNGPEQDILKVVGSLNIETLYLPVMDPLQVSDDQETIDSHSISFPLSL
ncbi:hypothetical protein CLU79DRAFT_179171 [Phycomyces nitens]|nr:hypothetical protein CLU79DRAFT_179171 [Phycomyces nitens]